MSSQAEILDEAATLKPLGARRLLTAGGIALIVAGMIFGDIFAVFVLHQNAASIEAELTGAAEAVAAGNAGLVRNHFSEISGLLESRGTKVDTHVHVIGFGYLALLLALLQPLIALSERLKTGLARLFLLGAVMLPVSVFLINYVGLGYSPFSDIGWASIFADLGGLFVIVASAFSLVGLARYLRAGDKGALAGLTPDRGWAGRFLLAGGTILVMAGFVHGAYYSVVDLGSHEARDHATLQAIVENAAAGDLSNAKVAVADYGMLQANKAVKIAAHSHIIEFGFLAMLLAFVQRYVFLAERWKRRWAVVMLAGSTVLPVFVLLELEWGLVAAGIADAGGLMVIAALIGMMVGVLRFSGKLDAGNETGV